MLPAHILNVIFKPLPEPVLDDPLARAVRQLNHKAAYAQEDPRLWPLLRSKYGAQQALRTYYPHTVEADIRLQQALSQMTKTANLIELVFKELSATAESKRLMEEFIQPIQSPAPAAKEPFDPEWPDGKPVDASQ
jgi:hypothetical protein